MTGLKKRSGMIALVVIVLASLMSLTAGVLAQEVKFENLWAKVQGEGVLKVGVTVADEPFTGKDPKTGEWDGIVIRLMRMLAEELEVDVEFIDTNWDYMIAGLQAKKWDISANLNERATRALVVNYSIPFYFYEVSYVYNKDNPKLKGATTNEDFDKKGVKCAVMSGCADDFALTRVVKNMEIVRFPDMNEIRMAVISGQADLFAANAAVNKMFVLAHKDWAEHYIPDPAISREGISFGFRKSVPLGQIQVLDIVIKYAINNGYMDEWEEEVGLHVIKSLEY